MTTPKLPVALKPELVVAIVGTREQTKELFE